MNAIAVKAIDIKAMTNAGHNYIGSGYRSVRPTTANRFLFDLHRLQKRRMRQNRPKYKKRGPVVVRGSLWPRVVPVTGSEAPQFRAHLTKAFSGIRKAL